MIQWVFRPEVPHQGIVGSSAMYAAVVLVATWLRFSQPDLTFLRDLSLPLAARIEGLKSTMSLFQTIALATCGGFLAALAPWAMAVLNTNSHVVHAEGDLFLLNAFSLGRVSTTGLAVLIGPVRAVVTVIRLSSAFSELRDQPKAQT